eukprot:COSAG05_NODE_5118_length_1259_cov_2.481034_1_plen_68_part_00
MASSMGGQEYQCIQKSLVRSGFEMTSDRVGALDRGAVILSLEERINEKGITRVRFQQGCVLSQFGTA